MNKEIKNCLNVKYFAKALIIYFYNFIVNIQKNKKIKAFLNAKLGCRSSYSSLHGSGCQGVTEAWFHDVLLLELLYCRLLSPESLSPFTFNDGLKKQPAVNATLKKENHVVKVYSTFSYHLSPADNR